MWTPNAEGDCETCAFHGKPHFGWCSWKYLDNEPEEPSVLGAGGGPPVIPPEVSVASALADADKALAVLFTMLQKAAPQGAVVADEVRANVRRAQKDFRVLVQELIRLRSRPISTAK